LGLGRGSSINSKDEKPIFEALYEAKLIPVK
jgi:hypothetical protein